MAEDHVSAEPAAGPEGLDWAERVEWILEHYEDGSRRAMGRKVGLSGQAVSAWARGETRPSGEGLAAIIRSYPELRARWLLTGRGAPTVTAAGADGESPPLAAGDPEEGRGMERAYEAGRRDAIVEMLEILTELVPDGRP